MDVQISLKQRQTLAITSIIHLVKNFLDTDGVSNCQQAKNGMESTAMGGCSMSKRNTTINTLLWFGAAIGLRRRRMKKTMFESTLLITSALVFISAFAVIDANAAGSDFNKRVYIGANVGISQLDPDASGIDATVDEKNDIGFGLSLGMDLSNRVSAELHVNDLGTATLDPDGEIDYKVYGMSALLYGLNSSVSRDLREGLSGYLRVGLDTMSNSANVPYELENNISWVLGLGAEYGMSNGLAVRGEVTRFYSDAYYARLGILYRFGKSSSDVRVESTIESEMATPMVEEAIVEKPELLIAGPEPLTKSKSRDWDADGVLDDVDQCLGSTQNTPVNAVGCALFEGVMEGVVFESASATLTSDAQRVLDSAAKDLLRYPDVRVAVMAHTDNQGDARLNLDLSRKRVIAVVRYLLSRGVLLDRMRAEAYGEKHPIANNETAAGRSRNRRVEFITITKENMGVPTRIQRGSYKTMNSASWRSVTG